MCNNNVLETRKHIIEECPRCAEFRTEFLKNKVKQVWELTEQHEATSILSRRITEGREF